MLFSSLSFIFLFFPLAWLGWWAGTAIHPRVGLAALLIASLAFYAWDRPENLILFFTAVGLSVFAVRLCEWSIRRGARSLLPLAGGILSLLALLGYFKYAGFLTGTLSEFAPGVVAVITVSLPIGISFYVLQAISTLVDYGRRGGDPPTARRILLYLAFFPHLIAGPIMRYHELAPQFEGASMRQRMELAKGLFLIALGLASKVVIADKLAPYVGSVFDAPAQVSPVAAWFATWAYALQIYFDFNGYCVIAVGLALMFGIRLPFNFLSPYKAVSVIDFWRRWNLTLSTFLRDYVYRPMGGGHARPWRQSANLLVTMVVSGLWHGAGWTFVVWGLLHGVALTTAHAWRRTNIVIPRLITQPVTLLVVVLLWVPFRANSIGDAVQLLKVMTGVVPGAAATESMPGAGTLGIVLVATAVALFVPNAATFADRFRRSSFWIATAGGILGFAILAQLYAGKSYDFIYFRF